MKKTNMYRFQLSVYIFLAFCKDFGLSENFLNRRRKQVSEEFLIYRFVTEEKGYCLVAKKGERSELLAYHLQLQPRCTSGNADASWSYLKGGLLKNAEHSKCLSASLTKNGHISGKLALLPCDKLNKYQAFACDNSCNLVLKMSSSSATYTLDHEERARDGIKIVIPLLRLGVGNHVASKWTIYADSGRDFICICDAPVALEDKVGAKITTSQGGEVVGKPCVFPFIYKGQDMWQCIYKNGKHICATNRNFDTNPNQWGVCPLSKRGTVSDFLPPALCDKPCGSGRVHKRRKCLFPPCSVPMLGIQPESCNVQECTGDQILAVGGHSYQFPAEGIMRLVQEGHISNCRFPFVVDGKSSEICVADHRRKRLWCSLTHNFDRHQKWAFCLAQTQGLWTSWLSLEEALCSKTCGRGNLIQTRKCHQPPCSGNSRLAGGGCNTQPCPECFRGIAGREYRGQKHVANDGTVCQRWNTQAPHSHPNETPMRYPELRRNFCRNPGNRGILPYCYRNDRQSPSVMYCDVILCNVNASTLGVPYTIPISFSDKHSVTTPCLFPFRYRNAWYSACMFLDDQAKGREKCPVSIDGAIKFRYCPSFVRGKWSDWVYAGDCTKSCGAGYQISFRWCYLAPCLGNAIRYENTKLCNTQPCSWSQPGTKECFTGRGITYDGMTSRSLDGYTCKPWDQVPVHSLVLFNSILPEDVPRLTKNHCRNPLPSAYHGPWCFVNGRNNKIWEYCDIPKCPTKEGEIFGLSFSEFRPQHNDSSCVFPFLGADNTLHSRCFPINPFSHKPTLRYCGFSLPSNFRQLIKNPIKPHLFNDEDARSREIYKLLNAVHVGFSKGVFGVCPPTTKGTWTSWSAETKCSVECGGGYIVRTRHCLHPPCSGKKFEESKQKKCNEQKCPTCLIGSGKLYRGLVSRGYLGDECMEWSRVNTDMTEFHPGKYPELQGRFCRNPGGLHAIPWCYKAIASVNVLNRIFCDVPHCLDKTNSFNTIPFTIPDRHNFPRYNQSGKACHFPYRFGDDWYYSCFRIDKKQIIYACPVKENAKQSSAFGICPPHYQGQWTVWKFSNTCSKPCGTGSKLYVRECLYPACQGTKYKFEGKCFNKKCVLERPLRENLDCFVGEGISYQGEEYTSSTGALCISWLAENVVHRYFDTGIPLVSSYCRNPAPLGYRMAPWCYIYASEIGQHWEYCNIRKCSRYEGEIMTLGGLGGNRPCHFPFKVNGIMRETCLSGSYDIVVNGQTVRKQSGHFCATAPTTIQNPNAGNIDWGVCPRIYRGTVSAWSLATGPDTCSRKCGRGQLRYRRKCRFEPCSAQTSYTKLAGSCNTQLCDDTCVDGSGANFRGNVTFTDGKGRCRNWDMFDLSGFELARSLFYTDHNYCRNIAPSRYRMPFCMISQSKIAVCDLPSCNKTRGVSTYGLNTDGGNCHFPFLRDGKPIRSCFSVGSGHTAKYCGTERGNNDVVKENKFAKCSKYKIGSWGDWNPTTECNRPCGGGKLFQWRLCRFPPCRGPTDRYIGTCNNFPCDKTKNCYDPSTKGIEFSSNKPKYTKGHKCVLFPFPGTGLKTACMTHRDRLPSLARPICLIKVDWSPKLQIKFCKVRHCPGTVDGPIMVQPLSDFLERPFSPCIFPFLYKGRKYYRCMHRSELLPPTEDGNRPKETLFWCSTIYDLSRDQEEWGYCMSVDIGKWGRWSQGLNQCTAFCLLFQSRRCLVFPCKGYGWRVLFQRCRHPMCSSRFSWGEWSHWTECEKCARIQIRYRNCVDKLRPNAKPNRETLKLCRGFSFEKWYCPKFDSCHHLLVYGRVDEAEVLEMTLTYSRRKFLGKADDGVTLLIAHPVLISTCFFAVLLSIT